MKSSVNYVKRMLSSFSLIASLFLAFLVSCTCSSVFANSCFLHLLGSYDTPGLALGVTISGTTVYVADGLSGLQIIDVTNPASPKLLGSYNTPDFAYGVTISGTTAYVADGISGLQIIDVTNPASPKLLGSYDTPGKALGVTISGTTAYVADAYDGLQIIDVTNPASPKHMGNYDTPDIASGVTISGTTAYVADGLSGLQIIDVTCDECGCPADTVKPTGCISGKVSDNAGNGLEGKKVILNRTLPSSPKVKKTVTTDRSGCYYFSNLRNGTYKVRVNLCTNGGIKTEKISKGSKKEGVNITCE